MLITGWSMTAYEALVLGVPVIAINPRSIFNYKNRYPDDSVPVAASLSELNGLYSDICSPNHLNQFVDERNKFLIWNNTYADNRSAYRVAQIIKKTLNES